MTEERSALTTTVENQEISPADVDRMNAERDQLSNTLKITGEQLDKVNKVVWSKEISVQKQMDSLERACERYNTLLYQLDLLGNTSTRFESLSKELELFIQQSRPESMVSVNLQKKVKVNYNSFIRSPHLNH